MNIEVTGVEELARKLDTLDLKARMAADRQLRKSAMKIVAEAQANIRKAPNANATGNLSNTGKVRGNPGSLSYEAGFEAKYAYYVEYGRKAGRMPPVKMLAEWAKKKLRVDDKHKMSVGFLVARAISRKGTKPNPFLKPAVDTVSKHLADDIAKAVDNAANKL